MSFIFSRTLALSTLLFFTIASVQVVLADQSVSKVTADAQTPLELKSSIIAQGKEEFFKNAGGEDSEILFGKRKYPATRIWKGIEKSVISKDRVSKKYMLVLEEYCPIMILSFMNNSEQLTGAGLDNIVEYSIASLKLASSKQKLASSKQKLASSKQKLASSKQKLASSNKELVDATIKAEILQRMVDRQKSLSK